MTMKEKIIDVLKGNKLTIKEITERINKKYKLNTDENRIRVYINRLKDPEKNPKNQIVEELAGRENRYKIYKLQVGSQTNNTELIDKFVLLMIKAGINSDDFGISIQESEIESSINRLQESDKLG